jgi:hypothetical protein
MSTTEILSVNKALAGFVKIWQTDPQTGESSLLVDKQNMILKGGAKLIAKALAGEPTAKIWGMYIGYNNGEGDFTKPGIDPEYTNRFINYTAPYGYLREKLTFTPSFLSSTDYDENTVLFSTMITTASSAGGAAFDTTSRIYEVALISAASPADPSKDTVFSRTNFNSVLYNSSYNFTITWGVRILLP